MGLLRHIYNDKNFINNTKDILLNDEFKKTRKIVHHGSNRFDHSLRVSYLSFKLSKICGCDSKAVARAGVLHDFFLERDDKNIKTETKMLLNHPTIAKNNAIKYFNINEKEQNIIESHMFPISSVAPKYKEAWLVSICDKIVAMFESFGFAKSQVAAWVLLFINFIK